MSFSLRIVFLFLIAIYSPFSCLGQNTEILKERRMEELAEKLSDTGETGSESLLILDDLTSYSLQPVFVNLATEDELLRLNLLNFSQVRSIVNYREKYGKILTLNELKILQGFDEALLLKIEPFVQFDPAPDSLPWKREKQLRQSLITRVKTTFPVAAGYFSKKGGPPEYMGEPYSYLARYRGSIGTSLDFGITGENDAGEDLFHGTNKGGFDFVSGFVGWKGKKWLEKIILGDYHLRFGQGINLWSGGGVSYNSDLSSLMRSGEGIRPYSSTDENQFFRGIAVRLKISSVAISLFCSGKRQDANVETDSEGRKYITSFRSDGFHRTLSEVSDEKNVGVQFFGGYCDFRHETWRIGVLASCQNFGLPVSKGVLPYKSKSFEGNTNLNFGLDYQFMLKKIMLFGEAGMTQDENAAVVNGLVWKAHPRFSFSLLHRFYDPSFQSFYSGAFSAGSDGRNEKGVFSAIEFFPSAKIKVSAQADAFYFPWLTYQTLSPAEGHTLSFQLEANLRPEMKFYLYSKIIQKPLKISGSTGVPEQFNERTNKWRIHADYRVGEGIRMRSRIEFSVYEFNAKREHGILVFQDMIHDLLPGLKYWLRLAFYRTEGYNSRIYAYENDLLYYFAIPEFHGTGIRSYLNVKWQPAGWLTLYAKAGFNLKSGETSLGSGNDATPGDHRWDTRCQVALKF
jgi:hypothetical protein